MNSEGRRRREPWWRRDKPVLLVTGGGVGALLVLLIVLAVSSSATKPSKDQSAELSGNAPAAVGSTGQEPQIGTAGSDCLENPSCRLEVSSEQLESYFGATNLWRRESVVTSEVGAGTFHIWTHWNEEAILTWQDKDGVVSVNLMVFAPYAFDSPDSELRDVLSQVLTQRWEQDYVSNIRSIWLHYSTNPGFQDQRPSSRIGNVIMEIYYLDALPAAGLTLHPEEYVGK